MLNVGEVFLINIRNKRVAPISDVVEIGLSIASIISLNLIDRKMKKSYDYRNNH